MRCMRGCLHDAGGCLQGTNVSAGKARGIVIGTGLNTEIGES